MASLFQCNSGAMHNPLLPAGDQTTASPFGFAPRQQCSSAPREPSTRTQNPIVTGTGVLGIKYRDGVMLAADTLGAFFGVFRRLSNVYDAPLTCSCMGVDTPPAS
jgi:hypothetical protein